MIKAKIKAEAEVKAKAEVKVDEEIRFQLKNFANFLITNWKQNVVQRFHQYAYLAKGISPS